MQLKYVIETTKCKFYFFYSQNKKKKKVESFIPYRDSVLTWLLRENLGTITIIMIIHTHPTKDTSASVCAVIYPFYLFPQEETLAQRWWQLSALLILTMMKPSAPFGEQDHFMHNFYFLFIYLIRTMHNNWHVSKSVWHELAVSC